MVLQIYQHTPYDFNMISGKAEIRPLNCESRVLGKDVRRIRQCQN